MLAVTQRNASVLAMQAAHQEESFPTWSVLAMCVDKEGKCVPHSYGRHTGGSM